MRGKILNLASALIFCAFMQSTYAYSDVEIDSFIQDLTQVISAHQAKKSVPLIPGVQWAVLEGSYDSDVRLNLNGSGWQSYIRRNFKVPDTNTFATSIITAVLLDAYRYGSAPLPMDEELATTVQFISESLDKSSPDTISKVGLWKTIYDKDIDGYVQDNVNWRYLNHLAQKLEFGTISGLVDMVGLGQFTHTFSYLMTYIGKQSQCYNLLPQDYDSTSAWVTLGSLLHLMQDELPVSWKIWHNGNLDLMATFDTFKEYAYRPFSSDSRVNTIDPRSYFSIRHFLDYAVAAGKDVILPVTFFYKTGEMSANRSCLPYMTTDIDTGVGANVVYGISMSILSGLVDSDLLEKDVDLGQLYHNTSALIAYHIRNNFHGSYRRACRYYLHRMFFYFFVARTLASLDTYRHHGPLPGKLLEMVYQEFKSALEEEATDFILSEVQSDKDGSYFDDFLGNADVTYDNQSLKRHEDRLFITANAANVLMYTWLTHDSSTGKSQWKAGTPFSVKSTVAGCVAWLVKHTLEGQYKPRNVFFGTAFNGPDMEGYYYPANRWEHEDGTQIEDISSVNISDFFMLGVEGYIPHAKYEAMLKEPHFGQMTPISFDSNNLEDSILFWNTDPLTYATILLASARYRQIEL